MKTRYVVISSVLVIAALWLRSPCRGGRCCSISPAVAAPVTTAVPNAVKGVPRLVDLGRTFCIPCKKMAPILAELKKEYAGRLDVEFIDVGENRGAAAKHSIRLIPTQVFLDSSGKELFRHEGFFSKEDILAQWKKLGIDLGSGK